MPSPIPVRLPRDLVAWLDQQARETAEPRSTVIRQLLRAAMERDRRRQRTTAPVTHDR
jgi:metal-responsive CopG/Arc/MetJ family transcriptional regulator